MNEQIKIDIVSLITDEVVGKFHHTARITPGNTIDQDRAALKEFALDLQDKIDKSMLRIVERIDDYTIVENQIDRHMSLEMADKIVMTPKLKSTATKWDVKSVADRIEQEAIRGGGAVPIRSSCIRYAKAALDMDNKDPPFDPEMG